MKKVLIAITTFAVTFAFAWPSFAQTVTNTATTAVRSKGLDCIVGTITALDAAKGSVTVGISKRGTKTFLVNAKTRIATAAKAVATLADLKVDYDRVAVAYSEDAGLFTACTIATTSSSIFDELVATTPTKNITNGMDDSHAQLIARKDAALARQGGVDLLFVGDSIVSYLGSARTVWDQYYAPRKALNLGFGGDTTVTLLWRLENGEIDGLAPKLTILLIGTNNSSRGSKPELIASGVKAICTTLRTKLPNTKILVLAIFPRSANPTDAVRVNNEAANKLIAQIADDQQIFFLNINDKFLEADGTLTTEVMRDLLHPSAKGFWIWADAMEPMVAKLMGDQPKHMTYTEDVGKSAARTIAPPSAEKTTLKALDRIGGAITALNTTNGSVTVQPTKGDPKTFIVNNKKTVAVLANSKVGDKVNVTYTEDTGKFTACTIIPLSAETPNKKTASDSAQGPSVSSKDLVATTPLSKMNLGWWAARHAEKVALAKQGNIDLLFVGDSIMHQFEDTGKAIWDQYYAPRKALNLGFGGDTTENVLWRLDNGEIDGISPKLTILMIGTNNTGHRQEKPQVIANAVKAICNRLETKLPNTKILVLAIIPRAAAPTDVLRVNNDAANQFIAQLADDKQIFFLNLNGKFLAADGTLAPEVMLPDLVHPSAKGYQIWAEAMEPMVVKLMGEQPKQ